MKKRMISFLLALILIASVIPATAVTANAASKWTTSVKAVGVLTEMQGFQAEPYESNGDFYIGYGSLVRDADGNKPANLAAAKELYRNPITKTKALELVQKYLEKTVDKTINEFTKKYNLDLTQNQHDALALYSHRTGNTAWQTDPLYQAVRAGKTGNEFLNAIANANVPSLNDEGLKAQMNLRLAEANMYLNNQYAYNRPSSFVYAVLVEDGTEGNATKLVAYNTANGYALDNLTVAGKDFLGWYVYDGTNDGKIEGAPISKLTKDHDGKKIVAKLANTGNEATANYKVRVSDLPSRAIFDKTFSREEVKDYKNSMDEKKIGELKAGSEFTVTGEMMRDGVKWIKGTGSGTDGKDITGWVYMGELPTTTAPSGKPVATATITANAGVDVMPGATTANSAAVLYHLKKGVTVSIYEIKVEYSEKGNIRWGKISVKNDFGDDVIGWINLDKADVKDASGVTDSVVGKTGKIINTEAVNVRKDAGTEFAAITALEKGTKVTILETKYNGAAQWGKVRWSGLKDGYTEGWVYMYYVEVDGASHSNPGNTPGDVKYTGVVTSNINLNVRKSADIYAAKVGSLPTGTKINVYETATSRNMKWGRIGDNQWVCLTYVKLTEVVNSDSSNSGSTTTTEIQATVTSNTLDVMKSYNNNSQKIGTLKKGDVVTILERNTEKTGTGTRIWGRFIKDGLEGWINLAYADVKTVTKVTNPGNGGNSSNTDNSGNSNANGAEAVIANCVAVNVREAAGTSSRQMLKLNNGTGVKLYEKTTVDNAPWGRITWNNGASEGWVCMYYVEMKSSTNVENGSNIGGTDSNTISAVGTVNSNIALNVRAGAGLGYAKIGTLNKGAKVTVYEQVSADGMIWGRIPYGNGNGYVCMSYINVDAATSTGKGVMGTIARCFKAVNVRSNPGTNNALVATINVGSRVEVFEQKLYSNQYWGRVAQGWICMDYVLLDSELPPGVILDETQPTTQATTQATEPPKETINKDNEIQYTINVIANDDLKVYNSASDTSLKVGKINANEALNILAVKGNNAELWGRIDQHATAGWVKMNTHKDSFVTYEIKGYVNTEDQPVFADYDTGSTVKDHLAVNQKVTINKLMVNGSTVFGWIGVINPGETNEKTINAWIPMGRISDKRIDVIPVCEKKTKDDKYANQTEGITNAAIEAVDAIIGGKVIFKLKAGVKAYIGEIHMDAGYVWGKVAFKDMEGWIKLNAVNYELDMTAGADLKVRMTKDTTDNDNVLGTLTGSFKVCELSFDSNGNLWGKVSGNANSVLNGGYVPVNKNTVTVASTGASIPNI